MSWTIFSLSITPIIIATAVVANGNSPLLDYGGLGLAGAVVFFLCRYLSAITKQHREERTELVNSMKNIIREDINSRIRLAEALEQRPCLQGDSRIDAKAE